jgi:hypothetical protein
MSTETDSRPSFLLSSQVLVFSDFNCPYCFALNERLDALGLADKVRWIGIEHRPDLPHGPCNAQADVDKLAFEVADMLRRAPDVQAHQPHAWLNSRHALLIQNAIEDDAPERAHELRRAIYRTYWQNPAGTLDEAALQGILDAMELALPEVEPDHLDELTALWRRRFDRIPAMLAPTGATHLGLQDATSVARFIGSALQDSLDGPGCR